MPGLAVVNLHDAGDRTTWGVKVGAKYDATRGHPYWQERMEVVDDLKTTTHWHFFP
jgi:hypothetical protein